MPLTVLRLCLVALLGASALAQPCNVGLPSGGPPAAPKGPHTPGKALAAEVRQGLADGTASEYITFSQILGEGGAQAMELADQAAVNAYNSAIQSGFSDAAAHHVSAEAWQSAWQQFRPRFLGEQARSALSVTAPMPAAPTNSTLPMHKIVVGTAGVHSQFATTVLK